MLRARQATSDQRDRRGFALIEAKTHLHLQPAAVQGADIARDLLAIRADDKMDTKSMPNSDTEDGAEAFAPAILQRGGVTSMLARK
jgi:hypothetical protein